MELVREMEEPLYGGLRPFADCDCEAQTSGHDGVFREFVAGLLKAGRVTRAGLVLSLIYLGRANSALAKKGAGQPQCCKRCAYLGCLILACKFLEDSPSQNTQWATLVNMAPERVCSIERSVLELLGYSLAVPDSHFRAWARVLYGPEAQIVIPAECRTDEGPAASVEDSSMTPPLTPEEQRNILGSVGLPWATQAAQTTLEAVP